MPVPSMGFTLQGRFPLAELYVLSDARALWWLVRKPPLQGFDPCERLSFPAEQAQPETATLMGFTSLGGSPFSPGSEDHPLLGFMANKQKS
jgi:hypothetical protein